MNDNEANMIIAYDRVIRNEDEKKLSNGFFRYTEEHNERMAIAVFKHVFEDILEWTPEDVVNNASKELIDCMKLSVPYSKLRYPKELNKSTDYFYIAYIVYPEKFKNVFSRQKLILNMYENILDKKDNKFPKDYFSSEDGGLRSKICLQRALTKEGGFKNVEDMYQKFANTKWAKNFFRKYRLDFVLDTLYKGDALDYLHHSLSSNQQDHLALAYYQFMRLFDKSKEQRMYMKLAKNNTQDETDEVASYDKNKHRYWYSKFMELFESTDAYDLWGELKENVIENKIIAEMPDE